LGSVGLVLDDVPLFGELAVGDADDVDHHPVDRSAREDVRAKFERLSLSPESQWPGRTERP
jgi:hypothetical protein